MHCDANNLRHRAEKRRNFKTRQVEINYFTIEICKLKFKKSKNRFKIIINDFTL